MAMSKQLYFLQGFAHRVAKTQWVLERATPEAKAFMSDVPSSIADPNFDQVVQPLIDLAGAKIQEWLT
eukprot:7881664-Pyramimonas_sp.AAC.1